MVIKGGARSAPGELALHLLRADTNEVVRVRELDGVAADTVRGALLELAAMGAGARSRRPLYHASINTARDELMTDEQKARAIDRLASELRLNGQPRIVVEHVKEGREHLHVVWLRIDCETGKAIPDSHNYRRHELVARELEQAFEHRHVQGAHIGREGVERPGRTPEAYEFMQTARSGITPEEARAVLKELWDRADTGQAFAAALDDAGWVLARGDKRDVLVALDPAGETHAINKKLTGLVAKDVRARLADIDADQLPSVDEARARQRDRQHEPEPAATIAPEPLKETARTEAPSPAESIAADPKAWEAAYWDAAARHLAEQERRNALMDQAQQAREMTERQDKALPAAVPVSPAVEPAVPAAETPKTAISPIPPAAAAMTPVGFGYSVRLDNHAWTSWQAPAARVTETQQHARQEPPATQVAAPLPEAAWQPSYEADQAKKAELGRLAAVIAAAKERLASLAGRLETAMERHRERAREAERQARPVPPSFVAAVQRGLAALWGRPEQPPERQEPGPGWGAPEHRAADPPPFQAMPTQAPAWTPGPPAKAKPPSPENFRIPRAESGPGKTARSPADKKGEALRQALARYRLPGADHENDFDIDL